jgi:uncharacterized protein YpiB (UPF0302 family)
MTKKTISDWAKKNFLHWFVESYQFHSPVPRQFLLKLAENEDLLSRIHIVLDGSYLRPLLVISTNRTGLPPLLYKTLDDNTVLDPAAIQTAVMEETGLFYLMLYFPDRSTSEPYQAVAEENLAPFDSASAHHILFQFELSLLNTAVRRDLERERLLSLIDQALDQKDKRKFKRLAKKLKSL